MYTHSSLKLNFHNFIFHSILVSFFPHFIAILYFFAWNFDLCFFLFWSAFIFYFFAGEIPIFISLGFRGLFNAHWTSWNLMLMKYYYRVWIEIVLHMMIDFILQLLVYLSNLYLGEMTDLSSFLERLVSLHFLLAQNKILTLAKTPNLMID